MQTRTVVPYQTEINGRPLTVYVHRSRRRRKTVAIQVNHGRVEVLAPWNEPRTTINEIIQRYADRIDQLLEHCPSASLREQLIDGGELPLFGEPRPVAASPGGRPPFTFRSGCFRFDPARPDAAADAEAWFRRRAREHLTERVAHWSPTVGAKPARIRIARQKTIWGSASEKGTLSFKWLLIFTPPALIDYVVVHELCHLREMNHSRKFWQLVESFIPDAQTRRQQLNHQGQSLHW